MVAKSPMKWLYQLNHSPTEGLLDGLTTHLKNLQESRCHLVWSRDAWTSPSPVIIPLNKNPPQEGTCNLSQMHHPQLLLLLYTVTDLHKDYPVPGKEDPFCLLWHPKLVTGGPTPLFQASPGQQALIYSLSSNPLRHLYLSSYVPLLLQRAFPAVLFLICGFLDEACPFTWMKSFLRTGFIPCRDAFRKIARVSAFSDLDWNSSLATC